MKYAWPTTVIKERSPSSRTNSSHDLRPRFELIYEFDNRTRLVVSDYYSNYIEVARLYRVTSRAVFKELKEIYARFGNPYTQIRDNGPQFASAEFSVFA